LQFRWSKSKIRMMKRCANCGTELPEGAQVCPGCGMKLAQTKKPVPRLAKALHPYAVMAYVVALSCLLVFLHLAIGPRGKAEGGSESETVSGEGNKGLLSRLSEETPVPRTMADKQYVNLLAFEQKASPIFSKLMELDSELSKPGYQISDSRWQELMSILNTLSAQAEDLYVPPVLGQCKPGLRNSVNEAKRAVVSLRSYQQTPKPELKSAFEEALALSRSQRNYCQSLIELVKKKLSPDITLKPEQLEKAARELKPPLPPPPPEAPPSSTQPSSPASSPQPTSRQDVKPTGSGFNYPGAVSGQEDTEEDSDEDESEMDEGDEDQGNDEEGVEQENGKDLNHSGEDEEEEE